MYFFGHRDCVTYGRIESDLAEAVENLIQNEDVDEFWLGTQGAFDACTLGVLTGLKKRYRHIRLCYVEAYRIPKSQETWYNDRFDDIIFLPELEKCRPKALLCKRNKTMVTSCDFLICYVRRKHGGAYTAMRHAEKNKKTVLNLAKHPIGMNDAPADTNQSD